MHAILPRDLLDFDQPEIRLVDQRGRLERMADTLVTHMAPGQAAQLPVDEGQQPVERRHLPPAPSLQQSGGVVPVTANAPSLHLPEWAPVAMSLASRPLSEGLDLFRRRSRLQE